MNPHEQAYGSAQEEYRQLLTAYETAASAEGSDPRALWEQASAVWERLCAFGGLEAVEPSMHFVLTFSAAVSASNSSEAHRIYGLMADGDRSTVDAHDALKPGSMKIWLSASPT